MNGELDDLAGVSTNQQIPAIPLNVTHPLTAVHMFCDAQRHTGGPAGSAIEIIDDERAACSASHKQRQRRDEMQCDSLCLPWDLVLR